MKKFVAYLNLFSIAAILISLILFMVYIINTNETIMRISVSLLFSFSILYAVTKNIIDKKYKFNPLTAYFLYKICRMKNIKAKQGDEILAIASQLPGFSNLTQQEAVDAYKLGRRLKNNR